MAAGKRVSAKIAENVSIVLRFHRTLVFVASALLLGLATACTSSSPPAAESRAPLQEQVTQWVNDERAKAHLAPLSNNPALDKAAQDAAVEIERGASLGQTGGTSKMADRMRAAGYEQASGAELLVTGEGPPARLLQEWHRSHARDFAVLVEPTYRDIGVGVTHRGGTLVCVILVALSEAESFNEKTASLSDLPRVRAETLEQVNAARAKRGGAPLKENATLDSVAQSQAEAILRGDVSDRAKISSQLASAVRGSAYRDADIGYAYSEGEFTVSDALSGNLGRPGANNPLLAAEMRDLGVGMAKGLSAQGYRVVWVEITGREMAAEAAEMSAALGDLAAIRKAMLARVNQERATLGLAPVRESAALDRAAQAHADDMVRRSYFGHQSPDGATVVNRAAKAGYSSASLGENIAQGEKTVDEVMIWWMASAGHREQIVNAGYTDLGVGLAYAEKNGSFSVVWVQAFGSPARSQRARP